MRTQEGTGSGPGRIQSSTGIFIQPDPAVFRAARSQPGVVTFCSALLRSLAPEPEEMNGQARRGFPKERRTAIQRILKALTVKGGSRDPKPTRD